MEADGSFAHGSHPSLRVGNADTFTLTHGGPVRFWWSLRGRFPAAAGQNIFSSLTAPDSSSILRPLQLLRQKPRR